MSIEGQNINNDKQYYETKLVNIGESILLFLLKLLSRDQKFSAICDESEIKVEI